MKAPAFWWRPPGLAARLLAPAGHLFGRIAAARMARPGLRPPLPVICIGNFVVGGAGKTPTAIAVAGLAASAGRTVCFLTRGYGGRLAGPVRVDPACHTAADVGDEALLLAAVAPTIVARDRAAAFPLLAGLGADLCLMDDGFQNPSIEKSAALLVVDAAVGIGNGRVMPAGPLRAPLTAQLPKADALLLLTPRHSHSAAKATAPGTASVLSAAEASGIPVLRADLVQSGADGLAGRRVYAFAGLGRPDKMFAQLRAGGADVAETRAFADHHPYDDADARAILSRADALGAIPVTTDKDAARLRGYDGPRGDLLARTAVVGVACVFAAPGQVLDLLDAATRRWRADD